MGWNVSWQIALYLYAHLSTACSYHYMVARTMRDKEAERDLREMQEMVFAGNMKVERLNDAVADYIGSRDSKVYIKRATRSKVIIGLCTIYVAIIAYGRFHYLLPWHVS